MAITEYGNCKRKHCPAFIVMLYDLAGETTYSLQKSYGIQNGSIDKLVKSGRLATRGTRGAARRTCKPLVAMLYQLTDDTVEAISSDLAISKSTVYKALRFCSVKHISKRPRRKSEEPRRKKISDTVEVIRYEDGRRAVLRCLVCGCEYECYRDWRTSHECPECKAKEAQRRKAEDKLKQRLARERERMDELAKGKTCAVCGQTFYSEYPTQRYCSGKCRRKAHNRSCDRRKRRNGISGKHSRRAREHGSPYEYGISLNKLIERDKGICQICGEPVDKNDLAYGSCGPWYPTIDHVRAIANGGSHTWDNVQLAHHSCNSNKGTSI